MNHQQGRGLDTLLKISKFQQSRCSVYEVAAIRRPRWGGGAKYCDTRVYLSVSSNISKITVNISPNSVCVLVSSSSEGSAIHIYISSFVDDVMFFT